MMDRRACRKEGNDMQLPYSDELEIQHLGRLFDKTSECYKFFWFQAILTKLEEGKSEFTFEELVDEMIAAAWYMVSEYHLNLGPKDHLELVVRHIHDTTDMKPSEKKTEILRYLRECRDKKVLDAKKILIKNVPYRLQAPFMPEVKSKELDIGIEERIQKINERKHLIYYFSRYHGLDTTVYMRPDWMLYFRKNQEIIKGWLQYHIITYLQKRNPSVPGIAEKLYPPRERKLQKVIRYWRMLMDLQPVHEIYCHKIVTSEELSIDHFVPWSYVAHDEFWNLHPTTKRINSSKSNQLPDWETYFPLFAEQEYVSYQMIWNYEEVHREFEKCAEEHLNNLEIRHRLYRKGLSRQEFQGQLREVLLPVYNGAKNSGFGNWVYLPPCAD